MLTISQVNSEAQIVASGNSYVSTRPEPLHSPLAATKPSLSRS